MFINFPLFNSFLSIVTRASRRRRTRVRSLSKSKPAPCTINLDSKLLSERWCQIRLTYFPDRPDIDSFRVKWSSRRQKRTLASCNSHRRIVSVAREMSHETAIQFLDPLLYHEMCHAILGDQVSKRGTKKMWHGPEFKTLEARHPGIDELNRWVLSGGWRHVVRSYRARESHRARSSKIK